MRAVIRMILVLAVMFPPLYPAAQKSDSGKSRPSKTEMAQKQAIRIADILEITDETRDRFIATFVNCQQEIWSLNKGSRKDKKATSLTDEQADSLIRARFDHAQRMLDARRRYYDEYRKFLTPCQINRVYELERNMMKQLNGKKRQNSHQADKARTHKPKAQDTPRRGAGSTKN